MLNSTFKTSDSHIQNTCFTIILYYNFNLYHLFNWYIVYYIILYHTLQQTTLLGTKTTIYYNFIIQYLFGWFLVIYIDCK